nr:hypothetical protein [Lysobacter enzymogenes]
MLPLAGLAQQQRHHLPGHHLLAFELGVEHARVGRGEIAVAGVEPRRQLQLLARPAPLAGRGEQLEQADAQLRIGRMLLRPFHRRTQRQVELASLEQAGTLLLGLRNGTDHGAVGSGMDEAAEPGSRRGRRDARIRTS